MSASPPFDRTDLPQHTRLLGSPVAEVYTAVTDVPGWPAWVPNLLDPVIAKDGDRFLFRARRDGRVEHHESRVIVRGLNHTFGIEVGEGRLWFRTRPSPPGTKVDVVLERPLTRSLVPVLGRRRRRARDQAWLAAVLDGLVARLDGSVPG